MNRIITALLASLLILGSTQSQALGELFGVPLGLYLENLDGWKCQLQERSGKTKKVQCAKEDGSPTPFGGFTTELVTFKEHSTLGICVISGTHYRPESQQDIFEYQNQLYPAWMFGYKLGVPSFPTTRALQAEKNPKKPVFTDVSTDKIGMEAGGKIMRWENLGPEKSILQFEAYNVAPKYRPLSEGDMHKVFTDNGIPQDMKINVALLTLYAEFWRECSVP